MLIAFFVGKYPIASETFIARQIQGMLARGHRVVVLAAEKGGVSAGGESSAGPEVIYFSGPTPGRWTAIRWLVHFARTALRTPAGRRQLSTALAAARFGDQTSLADIVVRAGRHLGSYDAIIAHFGPSGARAMYLQQAGLLDGPIATVFHGYDMSECGTLRRNLPHYRRMFRDTALLLPISRTWQRRLNGWGASAERMEVLRMGVDCERFEPPAFERALSRPLRVLSVARLVEKKGIGYAIGGVAQASAAIAYSIIGSGPYEVRLRHQAKNSQRNVIEFLGSRPHEAVFQALARSDIFILPSIVSSSGDMEGVPVALMEAMAMGVIVIATRHSGIPELVDDGVSGFLVEEGGSRAIADVLDRIASGSVDITAVRKAARDKVESTFNNNKLDGDLEDICGRLASESSGRGHGAR